MSVGDQIFLHHFFASCMTKTCHQNMSPKHVTKTKKKKKKKKNVTKTQSTRRNYESKKQINYCLAKRIII